MKKRITALIISFSMFFVILPSASAEGEIEVSAQAAALYWVNVELLGGLMYPIQLFGMDFELCQQGLALLALVPIWLYRGRQGYHSKPFQYACYAFYPVHMLLLALVLNFVNR